jgi:C4-dicarboxylate-specific signal transduction histidine kinase
VIKKEERERFVLKDEGADVEVLSESSLGVRMQRNNEELRETYAELQELKDIIDRKEPREKEKYLERQLIQADKMVTVGQLAGGVAHELNNLLTGVLGNAHFIDMEEDIRRIEARLESK